MDEPNAKGTINVTLSELVEIQNLMVNKPGCEVDEARQVCAFLGLDFQEMAHSCWILQVVDEVKQRISAKK